MSWMKSPGEKYGASLAPATPQKATTDATATASVAPVVMPTLGGLLSPSDPTFWFGAFAAVTVGLMTYSTVVPVK